MQASQTKLKAILPGNQLTTIITNQSLHDTACITNKNENNGNK